MTKHLDMFRLLCNVFLDACAKRESKEFCRGMYLCIKLYTTNLDKTYIWALAMTVKKVSFY